MAETPGSGSNSAHRSSYAGSANVPRRLSYASVVTGAATTTTANPPRTTGSAQTSITQQTHDHFAAHHSTEARLPGQEQEMYSSGTARRRGLSSSSYTKTGEHTIPPFWVPPYLENTRYARKLEAVYKARVRALRDQNAVSSTSSSSIWGKSSPARVAPSYRGVTHEVVESNPPAEDDITPLPQRLSANDKHQGLDILSDGLEVRYNGATGKDLEAASVRTDHGISPQCGIYYYEISIRQKSKDCAVAIGFSTSDFSLERLPGWEPKSWAYHGDDGKAFEGSSSGHPYKTGFGTTDVVGCGIDFNRKHAFFTKNGHDLGIAFKDIDFPSTIFPCIGMKKHTGVLISVNLGQSPFVYDMKHRMTEEEDIVSRQIMKTTTSKIHRNHPTEAAFTQELIAQFLSHGGYIETARAFTQQVEKEKEALYGADQPAFPDLRSPDTFDAEPRQQVRHLVLTGDIDAALNLTEEHFPGVLDEHEEIVFQLKCRKFIEIVLKAARIEKSRDPIYAANRHSNSRTSASVVDDVFDQAMELDDESQFATSNNGKGLLRSTSNAEEYDQVTADLLECGQALREEYGDKGNQDREKILHDMFSLVPYYQPQPSQNGHLLEPSGRTKVAEDLNSAIVSSLGRPPRAALETIYRQTEALLETLSLDGGPATLVDLHREVIR